MASHPGEDEPLLYDRDNGLSGIKDDNVRRGFISKVFGIVATQLAVTALLSYAIAATCGEIFKAAPGLELALTILCFVISVAILCMFECRPDDTMRRYPTNYLLLAVFTAAQSITVGITCAYYTGASIILIMGVTAFVVFALMVFATCTKIDFTGFGPYLYAACLILITFGFFVCVASLFELGSEPGQFVGRSPVFETLSLIYSCFAVLLFSFFIIYDTQLIVGGKHHKVHLDIDDFPMAAIMMYVDILALFQNLLNIFGDRD